MIPAGLAALHLDTLYEHRDGRILSTWQGAPGARVHFLRTSTANAWLVSSALPEDVAGRVEALCAAEPVEPDPSRWEAGEPSCLGEIRELVGVEGESRGPQFEFPDVLPSPRLPVELLDDWSDTETVPELEWLHAEPKSSAPIVVVRDDRGRVVSVCHTPARSARAAEAGVETALEWRGRGYGAAAVAGWARAVRGQGLVPLYGTDWSNPASRALARRLGLVLVAEGWHVG